MSTCGRLNDLHAGLFGEKDVVRLRIADFGLGAADWGLRIGDFVFIAPLPSRGLTRGEELGLPPRVSTTALRLHPPSSVGGETCFLARSVPARRDPQVLVQVDVSNDNEVRTIRQITVLTRLCRKPADSVSDHRKCEPSARTGDGSGFSRSCVGLLGFRDTMVL
jgi:hypothetical protein